MSSMKCSNLLDLAQELIDEILCHIDKPRDLTAFALASHLCANIAIPRHTEYRVICITRQRPNLWKHLARYPNLTSNIREVHIDFRKTRHGHLEKYPITLVDPVLDNSSGISEQDVTENVYKAFAAMKRLTTTTWRGSGTAPSAVVSNEARTFTVALTKLPSLQRLSLDCDRALRKELGSGAHPTGDISNLTHLRFQGLPSVTPALAANITRMLQNSPGLVHLHVQTSTLSLMAAPSACVLPMLITLSLDGNSRTSIVHFIQQHPTIEELRWAPTSVVHPFRPGSLPNCKRLRVSTYVLDALESCCHLPSGQSHRSIEAIQHEGVLAILGNDPYSYEFLDPASLVVLRTPQDLKTISAYAARFPMIRWLDVIPRGRIPTWTMDEWVEALSQFTHLETIGETNMYLDLVYTGEVTEPELIQKLALACPNLRYLNNFDLQQSEGHQLAIYRPTGEGADEGIDHDAVHYVVQKRRARSRQTVMFEPLQGDYDNSHSGYSEARAARLAHSLASPPLTVGRLSKQEIRLRTACSHLRSIHDILSRR
ncbi:hypothetical protein BDN72DRAFT_801569 [Pluteus cervinus]|uniref:Uncharacterized protein n=1 Tax=Pluteus cervinus TaxID=181527 RepID=A0ACD3AHR3_9AGAR|nr:hypothetical protein BDN72DRAFT_801569 [Pluteus cervinus]